MLKRKVIKQLQNKTKNRLPLKSIRRTKRFGDLAPI